MPPPKLPLTHFLCMPLVTETSMSDIRASLERFTSEVMDAGSGDANMAIPKKAIRPIGTLHITLGVMSLTSPERINGATELLQKLELPQLLREVENRLSPSAFAQKSSETDLAQDPSSVKPLVISLSSLNSMHTPKSTSILYAEPRDTSNRLLPFSSGLRDIFQREGFLVPDARPLLLHATIMNTIYASEHRLRGSNRHGEESSKEHTQHGHRKTGHGMKRGKLIVDATDIIGRYRTFEWAKDFRIEKVAICKMGAKKSIDDEGNPVEEYEEITSKPLP